MKEYAKYLSLVIACFIFTILGAGKVQAQTMSYPATATSYSNGNGTAFMDGNSLKYKDQGGKVTVLDTLDDEVMDRQATKLYIRGDRVYYSDFTGTYSVKTDGTDKKIISDKGRLIGGYGSSQIVYKDGYILKIAGEKSQKLFKTQTGKYSIFKGKVYDGMYVYNIVTGKKTSLKMYKNNGLTNPAYANQNINNYATKSSLFYISSTKKLVRVNIKNEKTVLCSDVDKIVGATGNRCIFLHNGYYYKSYGNKIQKVCKASDVTKKVSAIGGVRSQFKGIIKEAVLTNAGVVFNVQTYDTEQWTNTFVMVNTEGKLKVVRKGTEGFRLGWLAAKGNTIYYGKQINPENECFEYKTMSVK